MLGLKVYGYEMNVYEKGRLFTVRPFEVCCLDFADQIDARF